MIDLDKAVDKYKELRFMKWTDMQPGALADHRIKMSYALAALSDHLAELDSHVSHLKLLREQAKLEFMKHETNAKSDTLSKVKYGEKLLAAEKDLSRLKHLIHSGSEILNALSSKLRALELEARNQH